MKNIFTNTNVNTIKYYDFFLPELDLYIEIDGELRPQIIENKITINKQEHKNLLVINKQTLQDFYPSEA